MVHIFLDSGKHFIGSDPQGTTNPMVSFKVFNKKKFSKQFKDAGSASTLFFGEHFFWMQRNCEPDELEQTRIVIQAEDHAMLGSNSLIGSFDLDFSYVYTQTNHAIRNTWVGLANTEREDFSKVTGNLLMHVQITCEGDKQVDLEAEEEVKEGETVEQKILMPPSINGVPHQIVVRLIRGEGFPKLETFSKQIDALAEAHFGKKKIATEVVETEGDNRMCYWKEDLFLPTSLPNLKDKLILKFFDYEKAGSNDFIGQAYFNLAKIRKGHLAKY